MTYKLHCDICDRVVENELFPPMRWLISEEETTNLPKMPTPLEMCSECSPIFKEEIEAFLSRVKELSEHGRRRRV